MKTTRLRASDYQRTPWKNGLGFTDQIAIHPSSADLRRGDFMWRLSSARIEKSSPFSPFPLHDRILVVLSGGGVRLTHAIEESAELDSVDVPELEPYEFPGDVATRCELTSGPIVDFSIFLAKGLVDANVEVLRMADAESSELFISGTTAFIFVVKGGLRVAQSDISEGESLRLDFSNENRDESLSVLAADGGATALVVQLQY